MKGQPHRLPFRCSGQSRGLCCRRRRDTADELRVALLARVTAEGDAEHLRLVPDAIGDTDNHAMDTPPATDDGNRAFDVRRDCPLFRGLPHIHLP